MCWILEGFTYITYNWPLALTLAYPHENCSPGSAIRNISVLGNFKLIFNTCVNTLTIQCISRFLRLPGNLRRRQLASGGIHYWGQTRRIRVQHTNTDGTSRQLNGVLHFITDSTWAQAITAAESRISRLCSRRAPSNVTPVKSSFLQQGRWPKKEHSIIQSFRKLQHLSHPIAYLLIPHKIFQMTKNWKVWANRNFTHH